jgi:hypothetical protein
MRSISKGFLAGTSSSQRGNHSQARRFLLLSVIRQLIESRLICYDLGPYSLMSGSGGGGGGDPAGGGFCGSEDAPFLAGFGLDTKLFANA